MPVSRELPHTLKLVTVWLLVGLALFLGVSWWQAEQRASRITVDGGTIEIRRSADGHYHWRGRIEGRTVDFLVDTGATATAIPQQLADELGLVVEGTVSSATAAGLTQGRIVRADIELEGGVHARALRITALPALSHPLLGMDILSRLRFTQHDGVLTLQPQGDTR